MKKITLNPFMYYLCQNTKIIQISLHYSIFYIVKLQIIYNENDSFDFNIISLPPIVNKKCEKIFIIFSMNLEQHKRFHVFCTYVIETINKFPVNFKWF